MENNSGNIDPDSLEAIGNGIASSGIDSGLARIANWGSGGQLPTQNVTTPALNIGDIVGSLSSFGSSVRDRLANKGVELTNRLNRGVEYLSTRIGNPNGFELYQASGGDVPPLNIGDTLGGLSSDSLNFNAVPNNPTIPTTTTTPNSTTAITPNSTTPTTPNSTVPNTSRDASEDFLDLMMTAEGVKRHKGAEGGDADTHGYGLKESTRKQLGIPIGEPRKMAKQAYDHFYNTAKKDVPNIDSLSNPEKVFLVSHAWNANQVFPTAQRMIAAKEFNNATQKDMMEFVQNNRVTQTTSTGKEKVVYLPGLSNRRATEYNLLAKSRGWPTIDKASYSTSGGTFTLSNGTKFSFKKKLEPLKKKNTFAFNTENNASNDRV